MKPLLTCPPRKVTSSARQYKTVPRTVEQLVERIKTVGGPSEEGGDRFRERVVGALEELQRADLVRMRTDPDTRHDVWLLDHDYLTSGVREADRRANIWTALLQEGHEAFNEAGRSLARRWRSLLGLWPQIRLLGLRARGRFCYGEHGRYARWSLLRFVPVLALGITLGIGWQEFRYQLEIDRAGDIWNNLAFNSDFFNSHLNEMVWNGEDAEPLEPSVALLWELTRGAEAFRNAAIEIEVTSEAVARRFNRRPEPIIRAVVGLDRNRRENILEEMVWISSVDEVKLERWLAQLNIGAVLGSRDLEFHKAVALTISHYYRIPKVAALAERWLATSPLSSEAPNSPFVEAIIATIETAKDPEALAVLAQALASVPGFDKVAVKRAAGLIVAAMDVKGDPFALRALAQALGSLQGVDAAVVERAARLLVAAINEAVEVGNPLAIGNLGQGLAVLAPKLKARIAAQTTRALAATIAETASPAILGALVQALLVVPRVESADVEQTIRKIITVIEITTRATDLKLLAEALAALDAVSVNDTTKAAEVILAKIEATKNSFELGTLAQALAVLPAVEIADVDRVARAIITELKEFTEQSTRTTVEQWEVEFGAAFREGGKESVVDVLGSGLKQLAPRVTKPVATEIAEKVVGIMLVTKNPYDLETLAQTLPELQAEASVNDRAVKALAAAIISAEYPYTIGMLAHALITLPETEIPDTAQVLGKVKSALTSTTDPTALLSLVQVLGTLLQQRPTMEFATEIMAVLKFPTVAAETKGELLNILEAKVKPDKPFDGDLWAAVDWAERRGIDVQSPPERPGAPRE